MSPSEMVLALRKELGLSQARLGKVLGIHQTAVSRLESGSQDLRLIEYMKLQELAHKSGNLSALIIHSSLSFKGSIKRRKSA